MLPMPIHSPLCIQPGFPLPALATLCLGSFLGKEACQVTHEGGWKFQGVNTSGSSPQPIIGATMLSSIPTPKGHNGIEPTVAHE